MWSAIRNRLARHPLDDSKRQRELCSLVESVYQDMCNVAASYLRKEGPAEALQPAGLVHEAFLRLASSPSVQPADRFHLIALLCRQMRRILIEHGRQRSAEHHQALLHVPSPTFAEIPDITVALLLERLATVDERAAHVVELRVWGGFSNDEIAAALNVSKSTVLRDWEFARAWLLANLRHPQAL